MTRAVASLIDAQLLEEEDEPRPATVGRPSRRVRLARRSARVLGCVIGIHRCEMVASPLDGDVPSDAIRSFPTPQSYEALVNACVSTAQELIDEGEASVLSLGVSVPGLLNHREGRSLFSPNVHQLDNRTLGDDLGTRLQLPTTLVQECHALCLAEQVLGAAKDAPNFAMLDISEGLGLGVMLGGALMLGHSGLAGELGHITAVLDGRRCGCGNYGCLETVATDSALVHDVSARTGRPWKIDDLIAVVRRGELDIQVELDRAMQYLSVAVSAVLNVFNPQRLFIYGRLLDVRENLFHELLGLVKQRTLAPNFADCEIVRARGSKRLGAVAAAIQVATRARQPSQQ